MITETAATAEADKAATNGRHLRIVLVVSDDGDGFDPENTEPGLGL